MYLCMYILYVWMYAWLSHVPVVVYAIIVCTCIRAYIHVFMHACTCVCVCVCVGTCDAFVDFRWPNQTQEKQSSIKKNSLRYPGHTPGTRRLRVMVCVFFVAAAWLRCATRLVSYMMLLTVDALYSSPDWDERFSFEFNPSVFQRAFDSQPEQVSDIHSNRRRVAIQSDTVRRTHGTCDKPALWLSGCSISTARQPPPQPTYLCIPVSAPVCAERASAYPPASPRSTSRSAIGTKCRKQTLWAMRQSRRNS